MMRTSYRCKHLKIFMKMVAQNLKMAHTKITDNVNPVPTKLKEGDLVLIKDHTAKAFQPHYVDNYRIVSFKGNQVEVHAKLKVEIPHGYT